MQTLDALWRDLRDGLRSLTRRPTFTAVAVLSLALGIGANTAIFSLVNAVILRDVPIDRPEEVVNLYMHQSTFRFSTFSYPDFEDVRDGTTDVFSAIGGAQFTPVQVDGESGVDILFAEAVTGSYFSMLGIEAELGRTIRPEDDVSPGAHPVVMLAHWYWQERYAGDPDAVGQTVRIGGRGYDIIGVVAPDYAGSMRGVTPALYAPIMMVEELLGADVLDRRGNHSMFPKARLKPGVTVPQAETALAAVAAELTATDPNGWNRTNEFALVPTGDVVLFPPIDRFVRAAAWLLMVVVGLVLLLACTNLASFLLARALDRRRDIAIRLALGASRASLIRRLLAETTLLAVVAGTVGVALSTGLLGILQGADLPLPIPIDLDLSLDWNVLLFTLGVSVATGALLGAVPALQSTRPDVATTLKSETAGGGQPGQLRWRNALVVTQLTVSLMLLVGAGLFLRSFQQVQAVDPGFGQQPTALMTMMAATTRFTAEEGRLYMQRLLERFRQVPGVTSVGVTDLLPLTLTSSQNIGFNVDGFEPPGEDDFFNADRAEVDAGFFSAAGIPFHRGRNFTDADRPDSQAVAIISSATAARFWPDEDAVGRTLRRLGDNPDLTIVGVLADTNVRTIGEAPGLMVYRPFSQQWSPNFTVLATTTMDAEQTAVTLMSVEREVDPDLWVWETKTMARHLGVMLLPARLSAFLLSVFAVLALTLASIGLYGVVSYGVAQRTREVGIRMALGADTTQVVRLLTSSAVRLVLVGGAIGLVTSLVATRLLGSLLFGGQTFDPVTFVAVPLVLGLTAVGAAYVPARRAARLNPVTALRD
jgi:macrolide transport system ATP-binding/permease protein